MVRVRDLRKSFGELVAVNDVSFEIRQGECFGLLGPNGAGKTTTIGMITGVTTIGGGKISIDGDRGPDSPAVRRKIGLAPQSIALYEELTAEENIGLFAKLYGYHGARLKERVEWALEFSALSDRKSDQVSKYSGGMKRRLNLACSLVHEPTLLFLDEPTVGVDPQSRNHIFESIESLKSDGLTTVYTTHYMEEAQRLCDRVAIMDHGEILAMGTLDELLREYGGTSVVTVELQSLPSDTASLGGTLDEMTLRIETDRPLEEVVRLASEGLKFAEMKIERPDLETVFLALTGRRLRD